MQFDWFTFVAQIINFVILLVLLQRFLYKPVMQAMEAREKQITTRFQDTEEAAKKAHREAELFQDRRKDLEKQRNRLLRDAETAAQAQRKQLLEEARQETDEVRERWYAAIDQEKTLYLQDLRQRVSEQVFAIAGRVLKDLANTTLEEQIASVFFQRFQELGEQETAALKRAMQNARHQVVVRSAFGLNDQQKRTMTALLNKLSDDEIRVDFTDSPDLYCGIELQVHGQRIAWSLNEYIETLDYRLRALLDADNAIANQPEIYEETLV